MRESFTKPAVRAALCGCVAVCTLALRAAAQSSVALTIDNDFLYSPRNDDWNYTGGLAIEWTGEQVEQLGLTAPTRVVDEALLGWSHVLNGLPHASHTLVIGGTSYTPRDIADAEPIHGDRPYASLFYLSGRIRRTDDELRPGRALTTELTVGALGLDVAKDLQSELHDTTPRGRRELPNGWSHQISDGGEPTLEYRVAMDAVLLRRSTDERRDWLQTTAGAELGLGHNTYGWAGGVLKLGRMTSDHGVPGSLVGPLACSSDDSGGADGLRECYAFARAGGYGVAYNALLQGQFKNSEVTFNSSQIERFVGEFQYGFVLRYEGASIVYVLTRRSEEFKGEHADDHYFGTVTASWSWDF